MTVYHNIQDDTLASTQVLAAVYRLDEGEHPSFAEQELFPVNGISSAVDIHIFKQAGLPLSMCHNGHSVMQDGWTAYVSGQRQVPLSPLFVRDLSGRVIYLGAGPEVKQNSHWQHDWRVTFPKGCYDLTAETMGAENIENVFFTHFRTLDVAFQLELNVSGRPNMHAVPSYDARNLYPYKMRLDTFYIDGWKLPQMERVFARLMEDPETAKSVSEKFISRWKNRPKGQDYLSFYEENDGDTLFEQMFMQGCTVIPTFEACNGYNKVGKNFDLQDFWSGRAVEGLHEVVEFRKNNAPKGTILEVIIPGYVTARKITPAQVIVSDGSGYKSPHEEDKQPLVPDLSLPHTRTSATWGVTWLPTQPSHFEAPAIWGWEDITGRFMQLSGPLWDPLHYFYASVPLVVKAFRSPTIIGTFDVPEDMKIRFYPVVSMNRYETLSAPTAKYRLLNASPIQSAVDFVPAEKEVCGVGYHPLPVAYEYELDPFWFPELAPYLRVGEMPSKLSERVVGVIKSGISVEFAVHVTTTTPESLWLKDENNFCEATGEPDKDYPQLARYWEDKTEEHHLEQVPLWLPDVSETDLVRNIRRAIGGKPLKKQMEGLQKGMYEALYSFREQSLWWRRLRHRLFRKYPGWYVRCWWDMSVPEDVAEMARKNPKNGAKQVEQRLLEVNNKKRR